MPDLMITPEEWIKVNLDCDATEWDKLIGLLPSDLFEKISQLDKTINDDKNAAANMVCQLFKNREFNYIFLFTLLGIINIIQMVNEIKKE
jgi:hypothetical protein